jgi:hypothetical protein
MSFYVENKQESTFKTVPAGSHLARCYRIVDLGTQKSVYDTGPKSQRKVMLGWELFGEDSEGVPLLTDDGKPMAVFKNYTLSWADASTLRKDLQSWRGKPWSDAEAVRFDLKSILNAYCMINVIHRESNGKTYANVANVSPVPSMIKSAGLPTGINKPQLFMISEPDMELFESFGKGLKEKIMASPEWQARGNNSESDSEAMPF